MAISLLALPARLNQLARRILRGSNRLAKDGASAAVRALAEATPQDTGIHVSNWQVGINQAPSNVKSAHRPGRHLGVGHPANIEPTVAAANSVIANAGIFDDIVIVNNAPAIASLNNGSSSQAPAGFVQIASAAARARVRGGRVLR